MPTRERRAKLLGVSVDELPPDTRGRHGNHKRGPQHHRWNDERMLSEHGYIKIRIGTDHPLADPNGYAYEHLLVWAAAGRPLPSADEVLHHKDEIKTNNQLGNLEVKPRERHSTEHHSRLSDDHVVEIRTAYAGGLANMPTLAARFSVPFQLISKLVRGDTRKSAGGPITAGDKRRVGKRRAGRLLDGVEHNGSPGKCADG
jgi:hypothetical protein